MTEKHGSTRDTLHRPNKEEKKKRKEEGIQILVKCKPKSWYLGLVIVNKMVFRWKPSSRLQIHICADVQTLVSFFFKRHY